MARTTLLPLWLLLLLPALLAAAPLAQKSAGEVDLKTEIDRSIRWLRSSQAPDGGYGGGVEGTAWALQAFATSPRAYTRRDGPFVAGALDYLAGRQGEKGEIHDVGAEPLDRIGQSTLAWLALAHFEDPASQAIKARLAGYFQAPPTIAAEPKLSVEEARALSAKRLAERRADFSWSGKQGAVVHTCAALVELSRCHRVLKPKNAAAEQASLLPPFDDADRQSTVTSMRKGALFLIAVSEDGKWGAPGRPEAGLTAMAIGALLALPEPRPEEVQEVIDDGLDWLASLQDEDGSIHDGKLKNYITSAAILALVAGGKEKHAPVIEKARRFLIALQADEGEGYSEGDLYYGGIGYGMDERPDLSNLQMALEALAAAGTEPEDESFRRALKFLERVQNRSESNDVKLEGEDGAVIRAGDDGGASYMPGDSKAGFAVLADGTKVPRSYGSMTYALLKGFIFAGLSKDDPRMVAAWNWIQKNYTLDVNPGFEASEDPTASYQGLFYYFHTMAKALDLYGEELVVDGAGVKHPWRKQLCGRLIAMQRKDDGSWLNENAPRWWEGNPVLATSYALLILGTAMPAER